MSNVAQSNESTKKRGLVVRFFTHKATLPVTLFLLLVSGLVFSLQYADRPPVLDAISPEIGVPGSVLVLHGHHFGDTREGGSVIVAGRRPVSSSYIDWTDERISVRIPEDVGSGLAYVITRFGKSNGILFTNRNLIPVVVSDGAKPGVPRMESVEPSKGAIGTPITITGRNFGLTQGSGHVYFMAVSSSDEALEAGESTGVQVTGDELDYDYEAWNDQTIRVRVPDGATSGNIVVANDLGESNAVYFEVVDVPGTRVLGKKRGFQIFYSVEVRDAVGAEGSSLNLWVPGVVWAPHQRNIEYVRVPEPLWNDFLGLSRYQFTSLDPEAVYLINVTCWFDRYVLESSIIPSKVPAGYDTSSRLYREYTKPSEVVPSGDDGIREAAMSVVRRETNPYHRARALYGYLLRQLAFASKPEGKTVLDNYMAAEGNSYTYAVLFTALCRSVGIPARPVAGYLVSPGARPLVHYWAEFYIGNFGWFPVDAALGDGLTYRGIPSVEAPEEYYFGSLDSQHITFSRGVIPVRPLEPRANHVRREGMYSLQTIHEESSSDLTSYEIVWADIQVFDVW